MNQLRTISDDALAVLGNSRIDGATVYLPDERLDRPLYVAVNAALEAIGGTWNRKAKGHVFSDDPSDALDSLLLTGTYESPQDFGFFPTPEPLAREVIETARIQHGMSVLEPSAGTGALAIPAANITPVYCVNCIELLDKNVSILRDEGLSVAHVNFLHVEPVPVYQRVVMNPPFSRQQDIAHVLHAWEFVRPGGRLVSIMSAGVAFRRDRKTLAFQELVSRYGAMCANPDGSFKPSGTDVRTVMVVLNKDAA